MQTVFLSLGRPYKPEYAAFAKALEDKCQEFGLELKSVGYNVGTHGRPLMKVIEVLDESIAAVIVAYKRVEIEKGKEKGEPFTRTTYVTTPWSHIEAAMAYDRGLPLLVLVETGIKLEGLLEFGNDWYVHEMNMTAAALQDTQFKLQFESWRKAMQQPRKSLVVAPELEQITLGSFLKHVKLSHLIALLVGLITLLFLVFEWGMHVAGR